MVISSFAIILPMHIYDFDPQGNLTAAQKQEMYAFAASSYRDLYPEAHIIITGHGHSPSAGITNYADDVIWDAPQEMRPVGTFIGNPAQYKNVSPALNLARDKGFSLCLKSRGDGIIYHADYVRKFMYEQGDRLHLTQMTSFICPMLGDCVMFGPSALLAGIWDSKRPVAFENDGLINTGLALLQHTSRPLAEWNRLLFEVGAFHDTSDLGYVDLRWNWREHEAVLRANSEPTAYLWGRAPCWLRYEGPTITGFDRPIFHTRQTFYHAALRGILQTVPIAFSDHDLNDFQRQICAAVCKHGELKI